MSKADRDIRIVVLHRGWVVVGEYAESNGRFSVRNGYVIAYWCADHKGLGGLAAEGPLPGDRLDKCMGDIGSTLGAVILDIACDAKAWAKHV